MISAHTFALDRRFILSHGSTLRRGNHGTEYLVRPRTSVPPNGIIGQNAGVDEDCGSEWYLTWGAGKLDSCWKPHDAPLPFAGRPLAQDSNWCRFTLCRPSRLARTPKKTQTPKHQHQTESPSIGAIPLVSSTCESRFNFVPFRNVAKVLASVIRNSLLGRRLMENPIATWQFWASSSTNRHVTST